MNTAVQCIILLICIHNCASRVINVNCQCIRTIKSVNPSHISGARIYVPRQYCNKKEIIVILKDGSSQCLDPAERFAKAVEEMVEKLRQAKLQAAKMNTTTKTTLAPTLI